MASKKLNVTAIFGYIYMAVIIGASLWAMGWFVIALAGTLIHGNQVSCTDQQIPYSTYTVNDDSMYAGVTTIKTMGLNGTKHVCTHKDGTIASQSVVSQPVDEVKAVGTKSTTPVYTAPVLSGTYRTGAICNDGSQSSATGRGACSWHGGVSQWLYSN